MTPTPEQLHILQHALGLSQGPALVSHVLDFEALRALTRYQRAGDVERCLRQQGIRVFYARDGVWTTLELINAAGGLQPAANAPDAYPPDIV